MQFIKKNYYIISPKYYKTVALYHTSTYILTYGLYVKMLTVLL